MIKTESDEGNYTPTFKKRKFKDVGEGSSAVGKGSVIGSELADLAQEDFEDELMA